MPSPHPRVLQGSLNYVRFHTMFIYEACCDSGTIIAHAEHARAAAISHVIAVSVELHAALDAMPADDPCNYLRQSLQLLIPLLEQQKRRLDALEARGAIFESR